MNPPIETDNPWGAERIRGELLELGIKVSKRSLQKSIRRFRKSRTPSGQRGSTLDDTQFWTPDNAVRASVSV